jgi:ABC-type phosphate transport system permease subunit
VLAGAAWCVVYGFWTAALLIPLRRRVGKIFGEIERQA